ncbi:hypothetical protein RZS28_18195 [Methylocapsa polymorpha]|jgi:hypothetical protein|uniref:Uncharacterized protein n=1 Tax=Methylocapsa polymorpha TaxID=3080828 RepID=A0ABZ0HTM7_9HYPH|nr:hypothetical protein RZS28_18195 [Methylocapsa sp. RX1]
MDTEADFSVEQADEETILVRHCQEAHRYAFFIVAQDGRRCLGDGITIGNNATVNDGASFSGDARAFAEAAARERKLID